MTLMPSAWPRRTVAPEASDRPLPSGSSPPSTTTNRFFWTSGEDGRLRFLRCQACGYYLHPPLPALPAVRRPGARARGGERARRGVLATRSTTSRGTASTEPYVIVARRPSPSRRACASPPTSSAAPLDDVRIGMPVQVTFEQHDRVWFPALRAGGRRRMTDFERRSIISGIGQSDVGRRLGRTGLDLTLDAAARGHRRRRPHHRRHRRHRHLPGRRAAAPARASPGPGTPEVQDALRLEVSWHTGGIEGAAQLAAVVNAVMAVGRRPGPPRARVPHRHRVDRAGRRRPPGHRPRRRVAAAAAAPADGRLDPVEHPVPGLLGGQLAGAERPPPLPRVRHHAGAAGA